uniref:Uncharacterized protein n=1 Tax=Trypanosoma congolense (strain IL3000) TaxID=1068625 RepID=G0UQS1_TRYCI|nr:hypothetical protein, unlikely [Trypanosoma congolense IL3000]
MGEPVGETVLTHFCIICTNKRIKHGEDEANQTKKNVDKNEECCSALCARASCHVRRQGLSASNTHDGRSTLFYCNEYPHLFFPFSKHTIALNSRQVLMSMSTPPLAPSQGVIRNMYARDLPHTSRSETR